MRTRCPWLARLAAWLSLAMLSACASNRIVLQYEKETMVGMVGGFECDPEGLKAVGALITPSQRTLCSGALIASDTVLTAAHCVEGEDPAKLFFAIGPEPTKAEPIPIARWIKHPRYTGDMRGANDLALILLRGPVPGVTPLPFRKTSLPVYFRGRLTFVGYGSNNGVAKTGSGIKRCVRMPISMVDDGTFMNETRGSNTCHGDSGGPVLDYQDGRWEIVGVISSGDSQCERLGFSARVDVAAQWLEQIRASTGPRPVARRRPAWERGPPSW